MDGRERRAGNQGHYWEASSARVRLHPSLIVLSGVADGDELVA